MNEPYRLRYTNQIVGTFLLALLIATIVIVSVLTRASGYFVKPELFELNLPQSEVGSMQTGTEVIQLGRRIGQVRDLRYIGDTDTVKVTLAIEPEYRDAINADSEVTLERKFGLGVPVLKVRRRPGAVAPSASTKDHQINGFKGEIDRIEQMAGEVEQVRSAIERIQIKLDPTLDKIGVASDQVTRSLQTKIDPAMDASNAAMQSVEATSDAVRPKTIETLDQIQTTTARLESKVNQLTDQVADLIDDDITQTIASIKKSADAATEAAASVTQTSDQLNETRQQTGEEISETLQVLRETAELVQELTNETRAVVRIVRREADELPGTTERVNDTVNDTQDLVGEIRSHWLLRRYRDSSSSSEQVSPSSVRAGGPR